MDESWSRAQTWAEGQRWLLTAEQAQAAGLSRSQVHSRLRSGAWATVLQGVYLVDADVGGELDDRTWWRAALLAHGPDACLAGRTATRGHGVEGLPAVDVAVEIVLPSGVPRVRRHRREVPGGRRLEGPDVVVRQIPVDVSDVVSVDGMAMTGAVSSVIDAALQLDRQHALSILDSALHQGLLGQQSLADAVAAAKGRPGCRQLREVAAVADGRAESPLESRIRLICIDGGVPPDELQHRVHTPRGELLAVGDLAWLRRSRPLLGEADGAYVHGLPRAVYRDRRRSNSLTGCAYDVVRFTWADAGTPSYVLHVVRRALAA